MTKRKHLKRRVRERASKTGESYTAALRHLRARVQEASMSSTTEAKLTVNCSFCNKRNDEVKKLIGGPAVYICDECIGLCTTILDDDTKTSSGDAKPPSLDEAPLDQLVTMLGAMARTARSTEERLREWAHRLAKRGVPLATIAAEIGMSEAETSERFNL